MRKEEKSKRSKKDHLNSLENDSITRPILENTAFLETVSKKLRRRSVMEEVGGGGEINPPIICITGVDVCRARF